MNRTTSPLRPDPRNRRAAGSFSASLLAVSMALLGATACGREPAALAAPPAPPSAATAAAETAPSALDEVAATENLVLRPWTGDFDGMVERRLVRVLVTYSKTHYFVDRGTQRGLTYEFGRMFEDELNRRLGRGNLRVHVAFVPVRHDDLIPALLAGRGDVAAANLTITPERLAEVDFTAPTLRGVDEIVVSGPGGGAYTRAEDLSGREVYLRRSSSFFASVEALNRRLAAAGLPPATVREAPEVLSDEDILEMVNAGLVPATVMDRHIAEFWSQILDGLVLHRDAKLRTGGQIAMMIRKESPQLRAELDAFLARHPEGSKDRNILLQRYLRNTKFVLAATSQAERQKLFDTVELFRRYGERYSLDYLLLLAQGYQESRLDHGARSAVGAIGIMQVMPATGKELEVGDITELEPNIHAGVKYIRNLIDHYYADEPMTPLDKGLFAFASYNAGPGRIRQLRERAAKRGLDPNVWFNNVEVVAAEAIGRETVQYVGNIYKYYLAYRLIMAEREELEAAKREAGATPR